jgi:predicted metal-dependent enzyme (double-stranded beta helix superfamily)
VTELAAQRKELVSTSMDSIRRIINEKGVSRGALDEVKDILVSLTIEKDMFGDVEYPTPTPKEVAKVYLLSDDAGGDYSLYLISTRPRGRPSPVHDHGTWAVIAGLDGEEENTIYKRLDDGAAPGKATIEEDYKIVLSLGDAVALMPNDIHHINAISECPTRHFHLYGKGFDQQTDRIEFNLNEGTTKAVSGSFVPVDESRRIL